MSGTGRPTYRNRKGSANPASAYVSSAHVMGRDLPGHKKIKIREKKMLKREELEEKLKSLEQNAQTFDEISSEFDDDDESESIDESDEEDNNALLNELNRIKKEKQEAEENKLNEIQKQTISQFTNNQMINNDYSMNLKWTEESVFQNQAVNEPKEKNKFVNDLIRNDSHKKFLRKYLRT